MSSEVRLDPFDRLWAEMRTEVLEAIERVGASGNFILGQEVLAFEKQLAPLQGRSESIGCASGLDAIEIALRASGLRTGDKVLTTPLSAFATTLAIIRAGGIPVFVDTDRYGLMDLDLAEGHLRERPEIKFIVPVHLYGHCLDLERLEKLSRSSGAAVIEDCAQALGAASKGRPAGSAGTASALSFYPTKNLGALGDGGAVTTNDARLAEAARCLRHYGQSGKNVHVALGLNSRLDELHAAILRSAFLPRLAEWTGKRISIASRYLAGIRNPHVTVPGCPSWSESVWHIFPVLVTRSRESFRSHMRANAVQTAMHYPTPIPQQPAMQEAPHESIGALETARAYAERQVSLPIHPYLTPPEIERVVSAINAWVPPA